MWAGHTKSGAWFEQQPSWLLTPLLGAKWWEQGRVPLALNTTDKEASFSPFSPNAGSVERKPRGGRHLK